MKQGEKTLFKHYYKTYKILLVVALLGAFSSLIAEEFNPVEHEKKGTYRNIVRHLFEKEISRNIFIEKVSILNGKKELWKLYDFANGKKIWEITSHVDNAYYAETYYSKNGSLIYAIDMDRYISKDDLEGSVWSCEFFIKNNAVYSEVSLGHGKTERDNWDPNIILEMFEKRRKEFEILESK